VSLRKNKIVTLQIILELREVNLLWVIRENVVMNMNRQDELCQNTKPILQAHHTQVSFSHLEHSCSGNTLAKMASDPYYIATSLKDCTLHHHL